MTRADFVRGWLLLTAQPWGKAYRSTPQLTTGEPTPAEIQAEFYFKALATYQGHLWATACETYAKGDHWPSVDALKQTLRDLTPKVEKAAPADWGPEYITKEEFGVNLYECIVTISALHTIRQQINEAVYRKRDRDVKDLTARYKEHKGFLAHQLPALTQDETAQILHRYPDVATI